MTLAQKSTRLQSLQKRYDDLSNRLAALELASNSRESSDSRVKQLLLRQLNILQRLALLDGAAIDAVPSEQAQANGTSILANGADVSPTQQRLTLELLQRGIIKHRFVRVPECYYDRDLEFRRQCLGGHSVEHLCKSIILQNSRAPAHVVECSDPLNSKYYCVIVQYATRMNTDKVKNFVHKLSKGKLGKQYFNFRLAPEEISAQLTGYTHNAVTPLGLATEIPILMSHQIAELQPDFFWLGAGEVDLKVGFSAKDFVAAYQPMILDCTYEANAADWELER
ncbi:hypothetical protein WJX72_005561 [[Myrmecia] bisecta]|uniref:YbaK/aminoacyl-tRNA synthetase-associated domain-containing protein n=1 Tax=[Myrmecia] bisecta TaxID=41462 RepID=A0AAW1PLP9_9CHLO